MTNEVITLERTDFEKKIALVIAALSDAGYDPYAQLTGYLQTGDETFITRNGNARELIKTLDRDKIERYVINRFNDSTERKLNL